MKKFKVELCQQNKDEVTIEAKDIHEAIQKTKILRKIGWQIEAVDNKEYIAQCIWSDKAIFDGDDYTTDNSGEYMLVAEIPEDFGKQEE